MTHRLLVELGYRYSSEEFKELLHDYEFPRGSSVVFILNITNIGTSTFTGTLEEIRAEFTNMTSTERPSVKITSLAPNDKTSYEKEFKMYDEGRNWIKCKFSSVDGSPVECYQNRNVEPKPNEWVLSFRVINKEHLLIINLLKDIISKIH